MRSSCPCTRRSSRCWGRTWASRGPSTGASSVSAGRAPSSWTASPCSRAWRSPPISWVPRSRQSKAWPRAGVSIRSSRRSRSSAPPSAVTARRASSSPLRRSSPTGRILRSTHGHALIERIHTSQARALPGVYAVITGSDLPRVKFGILPVSQDEEALCTEKVRMVGDAVAAVAAVDEETAERACRLIDVDYEPLPALMSIQESLAHPEVRIHEYGDGPSVHKNVALQFGDVDPAFARADLVREDVFFFEGNNHLPMEQHAAVASAGPDGKLTLWSSTQTPHYVHRLLAKILDMPAAHIRVVATPVGGGFGGKLDAFAHEIAACRLSQLTGRPVKIACSREEVFYIHRGRHPVLMWIKTVFTRSGEITGCHLRTWLDGGAYGSYCVPSTFYSR